ncbi:sugar transferase [Leuconostoc gasicomitatum]|uniref:sugar transferase n=1 Tax=Leuconostoc gasicomitatum TaxID=115778 RepID=UPI000744C93E|nr:sugar transferase [Leuconostoc gasicomitatum]CUR63283.1 Sugar transferase EpsE [Leuconostoc gasicomitatum KG16-1]
MYRKATKRLTDLLGASLALIIFSPLMLILAVQIKILDGGKIIYKQERIGLNGEMFLLYKFRSMVPNAHEMKKELIEINEADGPIFKMHDDPRVTSVGKFMRVHSFDEIPQFINILRGEMSLVGPRPALPEEVSKYSSKEKKRLSVMPGLTGLWQTSGRSNLTYQQMIDLDLCYVTTQSIRLDIKIIFKTVFQMFNVNNNGAY